VSPLLAGARSVWLAAETALSRLLTSPPDSETDARLMALARESWCSVTGDAMLRHVERAWRSGVAGRAYARARVAWRALDPIQRVRFTATLIAGAALAHLLTMPLGPSEPAPARWVTPMGSFGLGILLAWAAPALVRGWHQVTGRD